MSQVHKETILQFGEGNFLRGFVDDFLQQLHDQGRYDGKVVVIQPLDGGLVETLNRQNGQYNLILRGLQGGQPVEIHRPISIISRGINPYTEYDAYLELAKNPDLRFVFSNTTESGIRFEAGDVWSAIPETFPGKLTQLLYVRYTAGLNGLVIMPCELIDHNGTALREAVLTYAEHWQLPEPFGKWITQSNDFVNTLVDRIVTGYPKADAEVLSARYGISDALLDTAEPFHLWVIEGNYEAELPFQAAGINVVWTPDVTPYKQRKVRILNGAHTVLVPIAMLKGYKTVRESLSDPHVEAFLRQCIYDEIIPGLDLPKDELVQFADSVMERFKNPSIDHYLSAIALNSVDKFKVRVMPSLLKYQAKFGQWPTGLMEAFEAFYVFYQTDLVNDSESAIAWMRSTPKDEVFQALCA